MDEGAFRFHPFDPDSGLIPEIAEFGPLIERSGGCGIIFIAVLDMETPHWCVQVDLYLSGRYLAAVEGVAASGSFFASISDSWGGVMVMSRTHG